ncbi:MAG: hypothetical protein Q9212_003839, partial [Teloschistes hypoglaucus]
MTRLLHTERTLTTTIRSLQPPPSTHETLMPSALYILLSSLTTTLITRNRSILLRATLPGLVGLGAAWTLLPHTMRNVGDLVWGWEEQVPV